jgi:hypothetical protein
LTGCGALPHHRGAMTDRPKPPATDRKAKLTAALRDNLRKRKDQARARAEPAPSAPAAPATKKPNPEP